MSLGLSLNNALSGLKVNQQSISVLSHNIANANTEGYSRQLVEQSAQYISGVGSGVRIDDVIRKVDKYLQRAVQTQGSEVGRVNVISDYYERINVLLGAPGAENSIDEFVTGFFNSVQTLSQTPDRTSARSEVLSGASRLAGSISSTAYDLQDLRYQADRDIAEAMNSANDMLRRLEGLNSALTTASSLGQSTAGLLDERDAALRSLSGLLDISTSFDSFGAVNITAGDGVALLDIRRHELRYTPQQSPDNFINDVTVNAIAVFDVDSAGNSIGVGKPLVSAGTQGNINSTLKGGKIEGLRLIRDEVLPAMLDQMDQLSANLRDAVNTIHNAGSGFPPATSLTGTRPINASDITGWTGDLRIAVLNKDGSPVPAAYANENYTGWRPLTLNLAMLNSGNGDGYPSTQAIIDEINHHFAAPGFKTTLGSLNNIELVSNTDQLLQGAAGLFNFDFDLENITADAAGFFVTAVTVRDDAAADITNLTQGAPRILLNPGGAYTTTALSNDVTLNLQGPPNVRVGDMIYLGTPGTANVDGIPAASLTGYFRVENVSGNSIQIIAGAPAVVGGTFADGSGVYLQEPYQTVEAGAITRTRTNGEMQVDLSASPSSAYYDLTVTLGTVDKDGNVSTSNITYRVKNGESNLRNDRYNSTAVTAGATRVAPQTIQNPMRAILVDEDGNEIAKSNGVYIDRSPSYLKLVSSNPDYVVVVDELSSSQVGDYTVVPAVQGTNWGFSHYFGLNNFFSSNNPTVSGDAVKNSAINLKVEQRLVDNPNLISSGSLTRQSQPADSTQPPQWTYVRYAGDNAIATRMAAISGQVVNFAAAGGLPSTGQTFSGYVSEMLGYIASRSSAATDDAQNAQTLYDGFKNRSDAISGVNLDEELANTVVFQNAYSATARIVTVVNQMFEDILQMV